MARPSIGFLEQDNSVDGMEAIKKFFTPEFRNRLDGIIQFGSLGMAVIKTVVDKFLTELQAQLDTKKVMLEVDDEARDWLATEGYDEKMGARPMQRLIQERIKRPLAEDVLFGVLSKNGGNVYVTVENGDLKVRCESPEGATAEEATAE
jgi:ATP-dependent Clp protease ATP-binding subunit ClpA